MLNLLKKILNLIFKREPEQHPVVASQPPLVWGNKVSAEFRAKVLDIADKIGCPADYLMAVMAFETARTFRPDIKNMAGSGATGLIQFMPSTAKSLGTTVEALAKMTAEDQLEWVYAYFKPYRGRIKTLSDVYMAVLWPAAIGKPEDHILWMKETRATTYKQNAGLDVNRDGAITKSEAASKVYDHLLEGGKPENLYTGG